MAAGSFYRIILVVGLITAAAVLGGFFGVYLLLIAMQELGIWLYALAAIVIISISVVLYVYESRRQKREKSPTEPETQTE